jgi:hypothetical protein
MNDVIKSHVIELEDLQIMILRHMKEVMAAEPELPNDGYPRHLAEEMAATHYEWSRQRDAIRILLGVQLVNLALEQL